MSPARSSRLRSLASRSVQSVALNGVDLVRFATALRGVPAFARDVRAFRAQLTAASMPPGPVTILPAFADRFGDAGAATGQYFHQDLHVARLIRDSAPSHHIDVGSRIDGFIAHLLVFRDVEVVDVRPLASSVAGLTFRQADATSMHGFESDSVESLSCLHAIEHFGLGRYGDPVDVDAPAKVAASFERVLSPGGRLYISAPVGRRRIEFDAHRVFDPHDLPEMLRGLMLVQFDGMDDAGTFTPDADPSDLRDQEYGLGIYTFVKSGSDERT